MGRRLKIEGLPRRDAAALAAKINAIIARPPERPRRMRGMCATGMRPEERRRLSEQAAAAAAVEASLSGDVH